MIRRLNWWLAVVVLAGGFAAGCSSAHKAGGQRGQEADENPAAVSRSEGQAGEALLEKRARSHAHYAAGVIHELNDQRELALEAFFQAARQTPEDEALILEVSERLVRGKQTEKALELLRQAVSRPNASGAIFARLGFAYAQLGQNEKAIEANRQAIRRSPHELAGYQNLFLNYLHTKQPETALKVLDEAANLPDADGGFLLSIGELYAAYALQYPSQRQRVYAQGLQLLRRINVFRLPTPQQRLKLADGFLLFGDSETATRIYLELLFRADSVPHLRDLLRTKLADIYLRARDRERAAEQLEAIVRDDPSNAQAYFFLGGIAYEEKRWAESVEFLKKAILFNPKLEQAYYDLVAGQIALGNTGDALATLESARARFRPNFVTEYLTGVAHQQQKSYAEAVKSFTQAEVIARATDTNRLTAGFYFQLGAASERSGDFELAEQSFEKCLQLSPEFDEALNYLGYMWAERGRNLEQARDLIARALKVEPNNAAYLDSMGWVLYKLNQPREALAYLLKAVAASEEPDATLYDHLGDIQAALGEREKAREAWQKSLSLEKNETVRKKLEAAGPE